MANYTVIADVGEELVRILREQLVPDLIPNQGSIGLCSPADPGDYALGVYLYDIRENEEIRVSGMQNHGVQEVKFPSVYLTLYYMVTAYSSGDVKYRDVEEQRILGRAMQVLHDYNRIPSSRIGAGMTGLDVIIEMNNPALDEKIKIWNTPNTPYKASAFYRVHPVELESLKTRTVKRVTEMKFEIGE